MKRILIASTDLMMIQFLVPHVQNLAENGYEVEIACSDVGGRMDEVREKLSPVVKKIHVVRLHRSPIHPENLRGYRDMCGVIDSSRFDIIWTNEPVMGVVTRLAARKARKQGTKVIYMVHGFHFYKGAPLLNWILYYPIERVMAPKADMIATVNREDYARAQKFCVPRVEYIHGIGINTDRLTEQGAQTNLREELGLDADAFIVLSVGELNKNKNQKVIIDAIARIPDQSIHYVLCGKGDQLAALQARAQKNGIADRVHFLGYRKDIFSICKQSDVFAMPSLREGLPVASLEAMYCGLPLLTSNIRGLSDIMVDFQSGFCSSPTDAEGFKIGLLRLKGNLLLRKKMGVKNQITVAPYCIQNTKQEVLNILKGE